MKYDKYKLCKRLKEIRLDRRNLYRSDSDTYNKYYCCITQEDFADALKVDRRTIIKWEKGESIPTLENLLTICDLLDCNIEYFLGADELPYINTIAKTSHFTGIDPKIIEKAISCSDYLDCLNFFMLPENCSELFNKVTLSAWKKFWVNQSLSNIKSPLIDLIKQAFDDFYSFTPFSEITPNNFKAYLIKYIPAEKLDFTSITDNESIINIKKSFSSLGYKDFLLKCSSDNIYNDFINYIVQLTYEPLSNQVFIELQKKKIANKFIETVTQYLSDI